MKTFIFFVLLGGFIWYLYNLGLDGKTKNIIPKDSKSIEKQLTKVNGKKDIVDFNDNIKDNKINKSIENTDKKEENSEKLYTLDNITYEKKLIGGEENGLFIGFPESKLFGKVLVLGSGALGYSNIESLVIERKNFDYVQVSISKNIWNSAGTGYLNENYKSYVYWNTLRPIDSKNKDSGVSFYVLEKQVNKIVYSKLYFDNNHKIVGKLKLKDFKIDDTKNIASQMQELNKSLKKENDSFEEVKKTDFLFKEIVR